MSITETQKIEAAEERFAIAQTLVAGGAAAARGYAARWMARKWDRVQPVFLATEARRSSYENMIASDSLACARRIVADGRAWYRDRDGLIVCTLAADASAGAVGYRRA